MRGSAYKIIFLKRLIIAWIIGVLFCAIALNLLSKAYKQYCEEYAIFCALSIGPSLQDRLSDYYPEGIPGERLYDEEKKWYFWVCENEETEREYKAFKASIEDVVSSSVSEVMRENEKNNEQYYLQPRGVFSPPFTLLQVGGIAAPGYPLRKRLLDEECFNKEGHFDFLNITSDVFKSGIDTYYELWGPSPQYDLQHDKGVFIVMYGIRIDNRLQRYDTNLRIAVGTSLFRAYPVQVILGIGFTLLFASVIGLISSFLTYREKAKVAMFQSRMDQCMDRGFDLVEEIIPSKQDMKRAELKDICLKVLQELDPSFRKANLDSHFSAEHSPVIGADTLLVSMAFKEILRHMIVYSDQGSTVTISLNEKYIVFEKNVTKEEYQKGLVLRAKPGLYHYEMSPDLLLAKEALERIGMDFSCGNVDDVLKIRCTFERLIVNTEDTKQYSSQVDRYSEIVEQSNRIVCKSEEE